MCESMVERAARAMYSDAQKQEIAFGEWNGRQSDVRVVYLSLARAAIEEMLTPTDAMIDMMYDADNDGEVEHAYRSAVRAALNEQATG